MLSGLLRSEEDRQEAVEEGAEQGQAVDHSPPNGGTPADGTPNGSAELPAAEGPAASKANGPAAANANGPAASKRLASDAGATTAGQEGEAPDGPKGQGGTAQNGPRLTSNLSKRTGRDRVDDVAETGAAQTEGEAVGTVIQKNVDTKVRLLLRPAVLA